MTEQQIRQFLRDEMRVVQAERQDAFCEMLQKFLEYQKAVVKNCSIPHVGERLSLYKWNKSWDDVIAGYSNKNNLTMLQESLLDDLVKYLDKEYDDVF